MFQLLPAGVFYLLLDLAFVFQEHVFLSATYSMTFTTDTATKTIILTFMLLNQEFFRGDRRIAGVFFGSACLSS